ncbi:MAG: hypothetical protein DRN12_00400 [Thermoplasmata archaeon]|nr:MAG: hypothetical protein DRN12_00400 [Thermoplasmata archaeon]HEC89567.1 hypothetical protein [Thermoplasmatales archaeon]
MNNQKKIIIQVSKENFDLMKKLGVSPQDVFSKGLEEVLRQKYREFSLMDDEDDEPEWFEFIEITNPSNDIERFMLKDEDFDNN